MSEDHQTRHDRELIELLNELRVALPGVQVLFAFLLILPFQGFSSVTSVQRTVYFIAFLAATGASIALIAPSVFHRLRWRARDKERLLEISNRLAIGGSLFLALAITAVVFLITDVLYGSPASLVVTIVVAAAFVVIWYLIPLSGRLGGSRKSVSDGT
jgi:phosphoglycerol transferase MdoB-like AlkP superfamily enzyme